MKSDRRHFLRRVLVATAATAVQKNAWSRENEDEQEEKRNRYLSRLLGGLSIGEPFFDSWIIEQAYPPMAGAVILHLRAPNEDLFRIDVCKRGRTALAPSFSKHLECFVMDGGGGEATYSSEMREALWVIVEALESNPMIDVLSEQLFTHRERLKFFPEAMSRAAKELIPTVVEGEW
ncbi:MAG: hypothetical protein VX278_14015 [Myxococcota bacterium]|nr:hypothetical protein [Myxococcota bacterium]